MDIPPLEAFLRLTDPVLKAFIERLQDNPYAYWYPMLADRPGDLDMDGTTALFREMQTRFGADDLTGGMPYMRYQPVKRTPDVFLMREYSPEMHEPIDIKDADGFRSRRASYGNSHPEVVNIGGTQFYGGFRSDFDERAALRGPFYAGEHCVIRQSVKVHGPSLIGSNVLLNTNAVCTRSIIGCGSQIEDHAVVKDSILGAGVYVKSGAKLEHRIKLGREEIVVGDRRIGRSKMGSVIGHGCVIGANAVLGDGSILMPNCTVPNGAILPAGIYDQATIDRLCA